MITSEGQDPNDNSLLVLKGPALIDGVAISMIIATDAEVITELLVDFAPADPVVKSDNFDFTATDEGATVVGVIPFDWRVAGFVTGQTVEIDGVSGTWEIAAIQDATLSDDNAILLLSSGDPIADALNVAATITGLLAGGTVTRTTGNWEDDGFIAGHLVTIENGLLGNWRLREISEDGLTMILEGEQLPDETGVDATFSVAVSMADSRLSTAAATCRSR